MAYMSQDKKKKIAVNVKEILKKWKLKGTLSVNHHSTLVLTIRSGAIDFMNDRVTKSTPIPTYIDVNVYWYQEHFVGDSKQALIELISAMNDGNHDRSDIQSDYFDVGWYVTVNIGNWNRPYILTK